MLNSREIERLVLENLGEIEGFEIAESLTMEQYEIIDDEIITKEDLAEFQEEVMTHTACFQSESYPDEPMIFVAVIEDTVSNLLLCIIADETMDKLIKKKLVRY